MMDARNLLNFLDKNGIAYVARSHTAVYRVDEYERLKLGLEGALCKNLLLGDRGGALFLVVVPVDKSLDLQGTARVLECTRLSFANPDELYEILGVRAGSLSPLALVNDHYGRVSLVVDETLADARRVLLHPIDNTLTVSIEMSALAEFCTSVGHAINWLRVPGRPGSAVRDR